MNIRLKLTLGSLAVALPAACGCDGDEAEDALSASQKLWGYWYSSSTNVLWQFRSSSGQSGRYRGLMWQGSSEGSACRITYLDCSVNTSGSTVTYYVTRAVGTGTNNAYDSGSTYEGPYSAGYSISGSCATMGAGAYSSSSGSMPRGC